jgi:hypothetical protein
MLKGITSTSSPLVPSLEPIHGTPTRHLSFPSEAIITRLSGLGLEAAPRRLWPVTTYTELRGNKGTTALRRPGDLRIVHVPRSERRRPRLLRQGRRTALIPSEQLPKNAKHAFWTEQMNGVVQWAGSR